MNELFRAVLQMSLTGSIVILVVLLARFIMKRFPKKYTYLLWLVVAFRLLCPVSPESSFSIFNLEPIRRSVSTAAEDTAPAEAVMVPSVADAGEGSPEKAERAVTAEAAHPASEDVRVQTVREEAGVKAKGTVIPSVAAAIWLTAAAAIIGYAVYRYLRIRRTLAGATRLGKRIYAGNMVDSPFVLGIIRPTIYLPSGLTKEETEYLLLHEKTHIKRGDTLFKAIGIVALALHWFNPLVWVAFALFCRDMEMSCDEEVIAVLGDRVKAEYSMSLVSFARKDHEKRFIVAPISFTGRIFGRSEVKMRINNVLNFKKSSKLIALLALALVAAVGLTCFFNARTRADETREKRTVESSDLTEEENENDQVVVEEETAAETEAEETVAETEAEPVSAEDLYETRHIDLFNADLIIPALPSGPVEFELPAGTIATEDNGMAYYMCEGEASDTDIFCKNYNDDFTYDQMLQFVAALEELGFSGTFDDYDGAEVFTASRADDNLCVIVETIHEGNYTRIAYYAMPEGGLHGSQIVFLG